MAESNAVASDSSASVFIPRKGTERRKITRIATALVVIAALATGAYGGYSVANHESIRREGMLRLETQGQLRAMSAEFSSLKKTDLAIVRDEIRNISKEMGLVPLSMIRSRESSFLKIYGYLKYNPQNLTLYATACYLGQGYFITAKHAITAVPDDPQMMIVSSKIQYHGREIPVRIVDMGEARHEAEDGDWAIVHVSEQIDLPALPVDISFAYNSIEPIFRLGNDYDKGILFSTGYVGQKTKNGLVVSLMDGHPGASGGGVLDSAGNLVGISIGREDKDFRLAFIQPLHKEMFRNIPNFKFVLSDPEP